MKRTFFLDTLCLIHDAPGIMFAGMLTEEELGESADERSFMLLRGAHTRTACSPVAAELPAMQSAEQTQSASHHPEQNSHSQQYNRVALVCTGPGNRGMNVWQAAHEDPSAL